MDLKRINVVNFRNIGRVDEIEFPSQGLLVAAAPNATGKTNFLESVAVLLRGKSWRARVEDCVAWGEDSFLLQGDLVGAEGEERHVAVRYHRPAKKIRIEEDGVPASLVAFYSHYPFVLFLPEDTFLFSRGPGGRRNFLNQILVAHPGYLSALVQYHRVLRRRNAALKEATSTEELESWTTLLSEQAETVWRHREGLIDYLSSRLEGVYEKVSGEKIKLVVSLRYGSPRKQDLADELRRAFSYEKKLRHTLYGPHRDDLIIEVAGRPAGVAFSRGQLRSLVVAMKIVAHGYMGQITKEEPLLLLDDVLSELDEVRQRALLEHLPKTQTVLTCTELPSTLKERDDLYLLDLRAIVNSKLAEKKKAKLGSVKV